MASSKEVSEAIEEQLREHKIVTFKLLSRILNLHSTTAKKYLAEFVGKEPSNKYVVTYTVFGRKENGELLLLLTKETDEDYFKNRKIIVIDRYVYSVQLSNSSFDPALIYNIDKSTYELQQMSLSSINYHTEIIRKDPQVFKAPVPTNGSLNGHGNSVEKDTRKISPPKKSAESAKKPSKNDFFRRTSPRKKTSESATVSNDSEKTKPNAAEKTKPNAAKKPKNAVSGFMTNFLSRGAVKKDAKNEPEKIEEEEPKKVESSPEPEKVEDEIKELPKEAKKGNKSQAKESTKKNKKEPAKKAKKKGQQKRKRIMLLDSDSDEESNHSDTNFDDVPEPEPEPEPVIVEQAEPEARVKVIDGKKRKRKVVEDQYEDEDGFMQTTKRVVYESCDSEDEPEKSSEKNTSIESAPPPEKKAKTEPVTIKKQKTILNFFRKPQQSKT